MPLRQNWRDCQEWRECGLPFSTTSNEACKMFDASLTQLVAFTNDPNVEGIEGSFNKMLAADPSFVMGHVMINGLTQLGMMTSADADKEYAGRIQHMLKLADSSNINEWERLHVDAVKSFTDGYWSDAAATWERILVEHPTDALALRMARDVYFYLGHPEQETDLMARVIPHYKPGVPLHEYMPGYYAFGLVQTNFHEKAEQYAKKGLELNRHDGWARHALGHVYETLGRHEEGIKLYTATQQDWTEADMLSCHNYWHWSLYYIEKGDYQAALDIFDEQILPRASKRKSAFNVADMSSLLYRLELEGVNVASRWKDAYEVCAAHTEDHVFTFGDAHILMALLGAEQKQATQCFMDSLKGFVRSGQGDTHHVMKECGAQLMESLVAYDNREYEQAVDLFLPVRYKIGEIGGSRAQQDVFKLFLINAAIKSPAVAHNKLARCLLVERQATKEESPMTDRLMAKALALHVD